VNLEVNNMRKADNVIVSGGSNGSCNHAEPLVQSASRVFRPTCERGQTVSASRAMRVSSRASSLPPAIKWMAIVVFAAAHAANAQFYIPESIGARGGFSSTGQGVAEFLQAEAFVEWNIPHLRTESDSGWFLQTKLSFSGGYLAGNGGQATVGTLGPAVTLGKLRLPVSLEAGFSPTLISAYRFGSVDFGEELQFTSYIGLNLDLSRHVRLGYRFQHMSNGDLAKPNPGLNINMFALSYVF
jgi:hypothetical protein